MTLGVQRFLLYTHNI